MDLKNRRFYVSPIQRKQVCWWNGSLSSVLAHDTRCILSLVNFTLCFPVVHHTHSDTDPLDPAKTHWLITFHLFSIKPYRVQIKFENRNYAELKLPSFQLTWNKHWSTWFLGHQGIQWLIKAPPSTLPLIDSESEYSCCSDRFKKKKKGNIQRIQCLIGRLNVRGEGAFLCSRVTVTFWKHCVKIYNGEPAVVFLRPVRLLPKTQRRSTFPAVARFFFFSPSKGALMDLPAGRKQARMTSGEP